MREIVEGVSAGGLALMINPQWQPGNLVNDFGIGPWRRRSEDFVGSFEEVYFLKQMRIAGDNVRCASSTIKCSGERIQYSICWYLRAWWILVGIQTRHNYCVRVVVIILIFVWQASTNISKWLASVPCTRRTESRAHYCLGALRPHCTYLYCRFLC